MMDTGSGGTGRSFYVVRYSALQRVNHWITAIVFILLALSGLAMFYPSLFFLSALFGGGAATRAIHPWLGLVLVISFFTLASGFVRNNLWNRDDLEWMLRIRSVITNAHEGLPDLGKYNAGQKGVYWSQIVLILTMLASGLVIWQEYFGAWTTIPVQRIAVLIHSLAAAVAITVIIIHIYAAFWIAGTGSAMTRGTVTGGWAYLHHRKWLRQMLAGGNPRHPGASSAGDD